MLRLLVLPGRLPAQLLAIRGVHHSTGAAALQFVANRSVAPKWRRRRAGAFVQYQAQTRLLLQLHEEMPTNDGRVRPDVGHQVARRGDQAEK